MAKIVVTGATGFVGRALAAHLETLGLPVTRVTRQSLPGMHQVADYAESPAGDVTIHLAEEPDCSKVNRMGKAYLREASNVVRDLAGRSGRFIYASSGMVYGDENESACTVDMPVIGTDLYSQSKILNEKLVLEAGGAVVRLSNLYGNGMSENTVISDIIKQIPGAGPVRVRDDRPVRDFLYVTDAVRAIGLMVANPCAGVLNIGSGIGTSIRTLAKLALRSVGEEARDIVATQPSSRRSVNILDISETQRVLGWSPDASLEDQLGKFFRNGARFDG